MTCAFLWVLEPIGVFLSPCCGVTVRAAARDVVSGAGVVAAPLEVEVVVSGEVPLFQAAVQVTERTFFAVAPRGAATPVVAVS